MVENTYKRKLVDYVKKNMRKNYSIETLRIALINQGYVRTIVDEAITAAVNEMAKEAPILKDKPQIEHEIITEEEPIIVEKKSFWKRILGFFK